MVGIFSILIIATQIFEDTLSFFSDDVTCQSEETCEMPSECQEQALLEKLPCEGIRLYNSLDGIGKNRAVELFEKGDSPKAAVEKAARELFDRQSQKYPFKKDYQDQFINPGK